MEAPRPPRPPENGGPATRLAPVGALDVRAKAEELAALLEAHRGERHLVVLQDFPDPDAIASALAYQEMVRAFAIDTTVAHEGLVSHPENRALVNLLEIELHTNLTDAELAAHQAAVFLDNQGTTSRLTTRVRQLGMPVLVVIDHHEPQHVLEPVFADLRPVGATATILAEYLRSERFLRLDRLVPAHVRVATALLHGLHSETGHFVRASPPEYEAAAFLSRFADPEVLERILGVRRSHGTMDVIQIALARRLLRGGFSLAGVGYVRWEDRDAIPQAADFLLTEENVHTAVVWGIVEDGDGREVVAGSLRTTSDVLGVDAFLKRALGRDATGRAYGGGRYRSGGFEIDVGFLADPEAAPEEREAKWALYDRLLRRRLLRAAGLDDEDHAMAS